MQSPCSELETEFGFVINCLYQNALSFLELQEWLYWKIKKEDELPTFIFSALDCGDINLIRDAVGAIQFRRFYFKLSESEWRAIFGIAYKRGNYSNESPSELCTEKTALKNLEKNPHILQRFRETFPFIKLDWID